ncbi:hypothetical protein GALMADRAFT_141036 [Galerina marginata CBS 339.88]|uniref:Uncharacterized protein n=1 Tax=Galerina marginata (strain CBS 339.88) TaxID=685588 RepID=A0A067SUV8_GALM3|nr:hypothetical protein GALMADRAFT_141036 [Galerina marginata CBS 339.88]
MSEMWVVVVGERGCGKSNFIAHLSGVYPGTPTLCPTEWTIAPGLRWFAEVSISGPSSPYFPALPGLRHVDIAIGSCEHRQDLLLLIKRAELAVFYPPAVSLDDILAYSDEEVTDAYAEFLLTEGLYSTTFINIKIHFPDFLPYSISILELPGIGGTGCPNTDEFLRELSLFWIDQPKAIIVPVVCVSNIVVELQGQKCLDKHGEAGKIRQHRDMNERCAEAPGVCVEELEPTEISPEMNRATAVLLGQECERSIFPELDRYRAFCQDLKCTRTTGRENTQQLRKWREYHTAKKGKACSRENGRRKKAAEVRHRMLKDAKSAAIKPSPGFLASTNDGGIFYAYSSEQIKSTSGRYGVRAEHNLDIGDHRASLKYKAHRRLTYAHSQSVVSMAQQCVAVRQEYESRFLVNVVESTEKLSAEHAVNLAQVARSTLVAEADLAMAKFKECQLQLILLQDAAEEAQTHLEDANRQLQNLDSIPSDRIASQKSPTLLAIDHHEPPHEPPEGEHPQYPLIPLSVLSSYEDHIRSFLPVDWYAGKTDLSSMCTTPVNSQAPLALPHSLTT